MKWWARTVFWVAVLVSCAWLVVTIAIARVGILRFITNGFTTAADRGALEVLIVSVLVFQPFVILFLIVRAIRFRNAGRPSRIVARAFYPLALALLLPADVWAIFYMDTQATTRMVERWHTGSIAYDCSATSPTADYDPKTAGPTKLKLTESRSLRALSTWLVTWPGKTPIKATSFRFRTGSIGGSEGIKWREPDGRRVIAYVSYSDVMVDHGPASLWVVLEPDDGTARGFDPYRKPSFICGPDPASYRE